MGAGVVVGVGGGVEGMGVSEGREVAVWGSGEVVSEGVGCRVVGLGAREERPQASWAKMKIQAAR